MGRSRDCAWGTRYGFGQTEKIRTSRKGAGFVRTLMKLTTFSALFLLVLGTGVAFAGLTTPSTGGYPPTTPPSTAEALSAAAGQAQSGLARTGSSSTISTVWIAVGLVVLGAALMLVARRRHSSTRAH